MKKEALTHPKTYDLADRLGISRSQAIGVLTLLFDFVEDHAIQGNIGKWPNGAIARACEWTGGADEFVEALVSSGWIDRCKTNRLIVHDWGDHCQSWVRAKLQKMGVGFAVPTKEASIEGTIDRISVATIEPTIERSIEPTTNLTKPNLTEPSQTKPLLTEPSPAKPKEFSNENSCRSESDGVKSADAKNFSSEIREVFAHYRKYHARSFPSPRSEMVEWRKIRERLVDGYTVEQLCEAIDGNHRSPYHCGENERQRTYHSLELIMRSADKVNQFLSIPEHPPDAISSKTMRTMQAACQFSEEDDF